MTKQEYIEHCRALFENPLMNLVKSIHLNEAEMVTLYGKGCVPKGYCTAHYFSGDVRTIRTGKLPRLTPDIGITRREDFEQGGKHYKKEG